MSQMVNIEMEIKDKVILLKTLEDLGYTHEENGILRDWKDISTGKKTDITITIKGIKNHVGFNYDKNTESYTLVGDFHGLGISGVNFRNDVKKKYTSNQVTSLLRKNKFIVKSQEVTNEGGIKIRARSMIA